MKPRNIPQLHSFDDVMDHVTHLQNSGYHRMGKWSLGQVCNHLAESIELTTGRHSWLVPRFLQKLFLGMFLRLTFLGKLGNLFGLRLPTGLPQRSPVEDKLGIDRLRQSTTRLQKLAPHQMDFHRWHCCHHLSFLPAKAAEEMPVHGGRDATASLA